MPCPRCGYDLKNLTSPKCPECGEGLSLRVGVTTPRFGWLLVAVAPGMFSGVCASLLAIPLSIAWIRRAGPAPWPIYAAEGFGILSGFVASLMYFRRGPFLRADPKAQRRTAVWVWGVHLAAFGLLVAALAWR